MMMGLKRQCAVVSKASGKVMGKKERPTNPFGKKRDLGLLLERKVHLVRLGVTRSSLTTLLELLCRRHLEPDDLSDIFVVDVVRPVQP